jgi:hypothetical protein
MGDREKGNFAHNVGGIIGTNRTGEMHEKLSIL